MGISWLALTTASSASPPKLVSKPQIRCCGSSIVSSWPAASSSSTREAVRDHLVAGLPLRTPRARPAARRRRRPSRPRGTAGRAAWSASESLAVALQEGERRHRLEDAGPHRVVVDRAGHHRDQRLARRRAPASAPPARAATCAGPCRRWPARRTSRSRRRAPRRRGSVDGTGMPAQRGQLGRTGALAAMIASRMSRTETSAAPDKSGDPDVTHARRRPDPVPQTRICSASLCASPVATRHVMRIWMQSKCGRRQPLGCCA